MSKRTINFEPPLETVGYFGEPAEIRTVTIDQRDGKHEVTLQGELAGAFLFTRGKGESFKAAVDTAFDNQAPNFTKRVSASKRRRHPSQANALAVICERASQGTPSQKPNP